MKIFHSVLPPLYPEGKVHVNTKKNMDKWINLNPELELERVIYDKEMCRNFLREFDTKYDFNVLKWFDYETDGRYKSDIWRICMIHEEGGIYVDIDQEPLTPFKGYLDFDKYDFCAAANMGLHNVSNGFIYAKKGSKILMENIKEMLHRYETNGPRGGCHSLGQVVTNLTGGEPLKMPLGEIKIGDELCLFLHEIGDESLKNVVQFINSFGYYSDNDTKRIMNSRYSTYYVDKNRRNEFVKI